MSSTRPDPRAIALAALAATTPLAARAAEPTPGYPEAVVQWGVQRGETCDGVARALYGSAKHARLVQRYNRVGCAGALPEGLTLVMPAAVTVVPDARLRFVTPKVRAKPPGAGWSDAAPGQPLTSSSSVNTMSDGRADIAFVDRTHVLMAPNTLVVIYGTARETRVSKTPPPTVEIEAGEVKAGLAALRGAPMEVAVKDGGRVRAASRDAVVERKGERTTVAVFDGSADMTSAGRSVTVPKDHGARFFTAKPPSPPRPLPSAPAWAAGGSEAVVLGLDGVGTIAARWEPVPKALSYRIELARDAAMLDLAAREEAPARVLSFRGERLPAGRYYLTVRAIDDEEYLGIAAEPRAITIVPARFAAGSGRLGGDVIEMSPYGAIAFPASPGVEIAIDTSPFEPLDAVTIDAAERAPREIRLRPQGGARATTIAVRYTPVAARIEPRRLAGGALEAKVALDGIPDADLPQAALRIRATLGARVEEVRLAPRGGLATARVPLEGARGPARLDVIDARGHVLGSWQGELGAPAAVTAPAPPRRLGLTAAPWQPGLTTDVTWWTPTAPDALSLHVTGGLADASAGALAEARATGSLGPAGLEAAVRTDATGDTSAADTSAWLGVRLRAHWARWSGFELGPALRVGVPVTRSSPPLRLEPGFAMAAPWGPLTWAINVGGRARLTDAADRAPAPSSQAFLLAGATYDLAAWLRAAAVVDTHLLLADPTGRAGLTLALEAGRTVFGGASLRASPWSDEQGHVVLGLGLGVRQP
jgi:hypothetical protein